MNKAEEYYYLMDKDPADLLIMARIQVAAIKGNFEDAGEMAYCRQVLNESMELFSRLDKQKLVEVMLRMINIYKRWMKGGEKE